VTKFERRLAGGVIAAWMFLSICTSTIRIGMRMAAHKFISPAGATFYEWEWLLEGTAAAMFAIYVWRQRGSRYRLVRIAGVGMILYLGMEVVNFGSWLLLRRFLPSAPQPAVEVLNSMLTVDIQHFFIIILGVATVVLMIDAWEKGIAAEQDAAQLEATLAEARLRNVRNEVQPALIRESLAEIEALLPLATSRAEAELLNLSDALRAALLRTTVRDEAEQRQLTGVAE
jgi:hypothetical protein